MKAYNSKKIKLDQNIDKGNLILAHLFAITGRLNFINKDISRKFYRANQEFPRDIRLHKNLRIKVTHGRRSK